MLNIICVNSGDKYSNDYVNILCDSVTRNIDSNTSFKFICFTNHPKGLDIDIEVRPLPIELEGRGWFNKLYLFKDGLFPEGDRIVYFDLKNVIISSLDDVIAYDGPFAILRDFIRPDGFQSGLMAWKANTLGMIWSDYIESGYPNVAGGDQSWIEKYPFYADPWQDMFPSAFVSYKIHNGYAGIPKGAKIVFFHGEPYPDQVKDGWVPHVWKIGGGTSLEFMNECNTDRSVIVSNIRYALSFKKDVISKQSDEHKGHAVIVGGGPSIKGYVDELKFRQSSGQTIVALNNSWEWLEKNNIPVLYHVMLDARKENEDFIPKSETIHKLYATQCHPNVTHFADTLWNALILDIVPDFDKTNDMFWIGAGTTVGVRSIFLMYALGYREFHLYGFDSCYEGDNGHAYEQTLNSGERIIDIEVCGRKFRAAPWMVTQMHDFLETAQYLTQQGCIFTIHGDGMLQHAAANGLDVSAAEKRSKEVLSRIKDMVNPVGVEVGVFTGEMSRRLLKRDDLTLYMVDSWKHHGEGTEYAKTDYHGKLSADQQEEYFIHSQKVVEFAGDRAVVVRKDSVSAANDFTDHSLDFVFLDADHTYDAIKNDIAAWSKRVKKNCILGGHDYNHPTYPEWGVKRAVDEFCNENGLKLELGDDYTWFVKIA